MNTSFQFGLKAPRETARRGAAWLSVFPAWRNCTDPVALELFDRATITALPAGANCYTEGIECTRFAMCLSGTIRVYKTAPDGRELVLYRVQSGECCAVATACLLSGMPFPAATLAETEVRVATLSKAEFLDGIARSPAFRDYAVRNQARALAVLANLVKTMAFDTVETRIARCLLERADTDGRVGITHQMLATELGTVREVVTRILKHFKRRNWIEIQRGTIQLRDRYGMSALVGY